MTQTRSTPRHARGLTDDALVLDPRSTSVLGYLRTAVDRLAGADPGLTQLRTAVQAVLGIAAGAVAAYAFVKVTGALQLSASDGPAALVSATNHALIIVAMLLAGIVAMMAGFTVQDATLRGQALSTLFLPVPMITTLAIGLALGAYRVPSLIWLVVVLSGAVYVRRWGPRGFAAGLVAFNGAFLGFFLHAELRLADIGWIAAEIFVGALASLIVRAALFRPNPGRTLERMRRSWTVRADQLVATSIALIDAADESGQAARTTRLRRQIVRLNESTLIVEAQLPASAPRHASAAARHLFDAELLLGNLVRFVAAIARLCPDGALRTRVRVCLSALLREDWAHACSGAEALLAWSGPTTRLTVLSHRLGATVQQYTEARQRLHEMVIDEDGSSAFTPTVALANGFLPGSMPVSAAASTTRGRGGRFDRTVLAPYVRATIQMAVAATIAVIVGDLVSGARLYWALLATFLAFMATTNSGEQARKAFFRVIGTAIGIVVGDVLVHVTGGHVWISLVFVLVALFFGIYLIRVNYTFMAMGITVTLSQLYVQLGEFSWSLLLLRLAETAIGVGAVLITVLVIVPLRPQRVLTTGTLLWFRALSAVVDGSLDRLLGAPATSPRPAIRALDAAYDSLEATAVPLRRATYGRNSAQLAELRAVAGAARSYARSLAVAAQESGIDGSTTLQAAARDLRGSIAAIDHRIETGEQGTYVRSASLVQIAAHALAEHDAPARDALRDLTMLDGALARLASALQMQLTDHDTLDALDPADRPGETSLRR